VRLTFSLSELRCGVRVCIGMVNSNQLTGGFTAFLCELPALWVPYNYYG
jgi:hypothetical protein